MENTLEFIKRLSTDMGFTLFVYKNEIWISGYRNNLKLDIFIKFLKDGKIKLIHEIPQERKIALFLEEHNLIDRLKNILNYEVA